MLVASSIKLNGDQRIKLLNLAQSKIASVRFARPYGIVLRTHDGYENITIADMLDTQGAFRSRADVIAMHKQGWVQLRKTFRAVDGPLTAPMRRKSCN